MSVPFRERNPVVIGALGFLAIGLMLVAGFKADRLPLIGGGDTYYAAFAEIGGLKPKNEVRIAGVRVGKVESIELDGDHVRVGFRITEDVDFGPQTSASIKIKTLLGASFLSLAPAGEGQLSEGAEIPLERTSSPYDVVDAFSGLAERSEQLDIGQLRKALNTLAREGKFAPGDFQNALRGLSRLSQNVAAKDAQLNTLLVNLRKVSTVLGDRSQDVVALMRDGDQLFAAVAARRQAISDLLGSTSTLSGELTKLVRDTRADLRPALGHLENVVQTLVNNQANLDNSLRLMAPFYRVFTNTLGNGPWFDTIIVNLPPVPQGAP